MTTVEFKIDDIKATKRPYAVATNMYKVKYYK